MDEDFIYRLETAFAKAPGLPEQKHGRISWLMRQIGGINNGEQPTFESVRRWFSGRSKPRGKNMELLCRVLNVDKAWLAYGAAPSGTRREQVRASDRADGAVYYVLGKFSLDGVSAGMPMDDDALAANACIDIEAIVDQRCRRFTVSTAEANNEGSGYVARPRMPSWSNDHLIVVPGAVGVHQVFLLKPDILSLIAKNRGDYAEIAVSGITGTAISFETITGDDNIRMTALTSMRDV